MVNQQGYELWNKQHQKTLHIEDLFMNWNGKIDCHNKFLWNASLPCCLNRFFHVAIHLQQLEWAGPTIFAGFCGVDHNHSWSWIIFMYACSQHHFDAQKSGLRILWFSDCFFYRIQSVISARVVDILFFITRDGSVVLFPVVVAQSSTFGYGFSQVLCRMWGLGWVIKAMGNPPIFLELW